MTDMALKTNRNRITRMALAIVFLAIAGSMLAVARGAKPEQKAAPGAVRPALTVRTTSLQPEKWARTLMATGSILPWQEAIISAQVQGLRIADVRVSIGEHVEQGDVLVTLDNLARPAEGDAHSVQGRIIAPDSGIISAASATVGSMSQPGMELFRLIRKGRLEWRADLTAEELMLLRKGMPAEVALGEGRIIKGVVRAISPSVNPQTRYGYALVTLSDSGGIVAGAFARGTFDISGGKRMLMSLPQASVMQRDGRNFVLVVGADYHVHERTVAVGQRNGDRVEIKSGLKAGEAVVERGAAFLTDGDVVQVVEG